jgi:hypothetical protein
MISRRVRTGARSCQIPARSRGVNSDPRDLPPVTHFEPSSGLFPSPSPSLRSLPWSLRKSFPRPPSRQQRDLAAIRLRLTGGWQCRIQMEMALINL